MPILVIYRGPGVTPADYAPYEADIRAGDAPPEALLHQVAFDDEGLVVVDTWTSRAALEAWTESRIKPTLAKHGIDYVTPEIMDVDLIAAPNALDSVPKLKVLASA